MGKLEREKNYIFQRKKYALDIYETLLIMFHYKGGNDIFAPGDDMRIHALSSAIHKQADVHVVIARHR